MNRKLAGVAIAGAAALALAGCSGGGNAAGGDDATAAATGELTVWLVGTSGDDVKTVAEKLDKDIEAILNK